MTALHKLGEQLNCSICLNTMTNPVQIRCPSLHAFDQDCIQNWFSNHHDCPLCRADVINKTLTKSLPLVGMIEIHSQMLQGRVQQVTWSISIWPFLQKIWQWLLPPPRPPSLVIQLFFQKSPELTTMKMVVDQSEVVPAPAAATAMSNLIKRVVKLGGPSFEDGRFYHCELQRKDRNFTLHVVPSPGRPVLILIKDDDAKGLAGPYFNRIK